MTLPTLLTIDQAAQYALVSPWTVRGWIRRGELGHTRLGGCIRVRQEDLAAMISAGNVPAKATDREAVCV